MFNHFIQDLRYGLRTLRKKPGFTLVAVLTLAVGIGANTTVFSIVNAVLLRALPYRNPERLVFVRDIQQNHPGFPASIPEYVSWRDNSRDFLELTAFFPTTVNLSGERQPERLGALLTTASLLPVLKVAPLLGRNLTSADENSKAGVAMISYELWQRRFGGDRNVLGKVVRLDANDVEIVGVLPPGLRERVPNYFTGYTTPDVWLPLQINAQSLANGSHYLTVVGRMKAGVSFQQAQAEMAAVSRHLKEQGRKDGIILYDLTNRLVGKLRPMLVLLLGAVGFVLLIVCANVANVLLTRATTRQKEISIRMALGAQRQRLVRQLLTESLLLALMGGALGLLFSSAAMSLVGSTAALWVPSGVRIGIDSSVLLFTLAVSLGTGVLFGLAPALHAGLTNINETLKEGGRQSGPGRVGLRFRNALVVVEVTLSALLLIGAGLLIHSFITLNDVDMGFNPDHVVVTEIPLSTGKYNTLPKIVSFYDQLLNRVESLPGVESAGIIQVLPVPGGWNTYIKIEGHTFEEGKRPLIDNRTVKGTYFQAMGIPLLMGRDFNAQDHRQKAPPVAIVNQEFVRRFFPDQSPLGKNIYPGTVPIPIVGVVGNVKNSPQAKGPRPTYYLPFELNPNQTMELVIRSNMDLKTLIGPLRETVLRIDPEQPISQTRSMRDVISKYLSQRAFLVHIMTIFAALALFLAAIGIYGVVSYSVSQRTQEIGIRMALGAEQTSIQKLVLRYGLVLTVVGLVLGVGASFGLSQYISSLLFGITASDPVIYVFVCIALFLIALLACIIPAHRASRVDPLVALRYE